MDEIDCSHIYNESQHYHSVLHLKSKNLVYIIPEDTKKIYEYSLETYECKLSQISLPAQHTCMTQFIMTKDEKYVIQFANNYDKEIWIWNLNTMTFYKSNMHSPDEGLNGVILRDNMHESELLTPGFIRDCWTMTEYVDLRFPEAEIIEIIKQYSFEQIVHAFGDGFHGSVALTDILQYT